MTVTILINVRINMDEDSAVNVSAITNFKNRNSKVNNFNF